MEEQAGPTQECNIKSGESTFRESLLKQTAQDERRKRVKKMGLKNGGMKSGERPAAMKEEGKKGTVGYSATANSWKDIS